MCDARYRYDQGRLWEQLHRPGQALGQRRANSVTGYYSALSRRRNRDRLTHRHQAPWRRTWPPAGGAARTPPAASRSVCPRLVTGLAVPPPPPAAPAPPPASLLLAAAASPPAPHPPSLLRSSVWIGVHPWLFGLLRYSRLLSARPSGPPRRVLRRLTLHSPLHASRNEAHSSVQQCLGAASSPRPPAHPGVFPARLVERSGTSHKALRHVAPAPGRNHPTPSPYAGPPSECARSEAARSSAWNARLRPLPGPPIYFAVS